MRGVLRIDSNVLGARLSCNILLTREAVNPPSVITSVALS